jgi:hypothetical protein
MTRSFRALALAAVCMLAFAPAGCGGNPKTYRIPGRLVYGDGTPVPGATVVLNTEHQGKRVTARGMVQPDGTFELTTFTDKDGVIEGEHEVTVVPLPSEDSAKSTKAVVAPKYSNAETSGLKVTVTPATPEILIKIEPANKK